MGVDAEVLEVNAIREDADTTVTHRLAPQGLEGVTIDL
jgi:hypothetical protein